MWIALVFLYALLKGARDILKKLAMEKGGLMQVLFFYTLLCFLMALPQSADAFDIPDFACLLPVLLKSAVLFLAWLMNFYSIEKMPVSLYGVLDLSRVVFSTLFGVFLLSEALTPWQTAGLFIVLAGLALLKFGKKDSSESARERISPRLLLTALVGCGLTAFSGTLDKLIMRTGKITSSQLLFWYCLFLLIFYFVYMLVSRTPFNIKSSLKNKWIYLMSLSLVVGDRVLFIANSSPECKVTLMTLIKQASCVVIILGGKLVFGEKQILYKLFCAAVIILGIMTALV